MSEFENYVLFRKHCLKRTKPCAVRLVVFPKCSDLRYRESDYAFDYVTI